jgi:hypothetical protein
MTTRRLVPVLFSVVALFAATAHADLTERQERARTRRPQTNGATFTVGEIHGMYEMYVNIHATNDVYLPAGLVLASNNPGEQKFVLDTSVELEAGQDARVQVFCMDHDLIAASPGTSMRAVDHARRPVARILADRSVSAQVRQQAIWSVRGSPEHFRHEPEVVALLDRIEYRGRR